MVVNFFNLLAQSELMNKYVSNTRSPESSYWFPEKASTMGPDVDFMYMSILWVSTAFFLIIVGAMCYLVIKYRRRPGVGPQPSESHNTTLEIMWSVLPSIILVWFFYEGARGYMSSKFPPAGAEEIVVTGKKWDWTFTYPDGDQSAELHLVIDRPVKLILRSDDVLHSFYVPAFRQKMDVVPGRYTYYFVQPTMTGIFRVFCTEYCGENHSWMKTWCHVHKSDDERKAQTQWINNDHKAWENGERLYKMNCAGCHNINGVASTGPALNTIWGTEETLVTGKKVKVDDGYVLKSLEDPNADVVAGFGPISKMQTFRGKLSGKDVDYIIAFLKHLKNPGTGDSLEPANGAQPPDGSIPAPTDGKAPNEPAKNDSETPNQAGDGKQGGG